MAPRKPKRAPASAPASASSCRRHLTIVALAALAAHVLCLGAPFYLDDQPHILKSPRVLDPVNPEAGVFHGTWNVANDRISYRPGQRSATYLLWNLVHAIAGFSSPAFHALNLILHALLSVVVYFVARELLAADRLPARTPASPETIAFWAALLFAVHPLGSEVTHYAAQTSIELVTLFAMLAAWFTLLWLGSRRLRWIAATLAAVSAAALSKEVGVFHSGMNVALIVLALNPWNRWTAWARRRIGPLLLAGVPLLGAAAWLMAQRGWFRLASSSFRSPDLPWHLLTQARVFWQYTWRMFFPVHLCSDHLIPRTVSAEDTVAWIAAGGLAALLIGVAVAWLWRRDLRLYALPAALILVHLLLRFLWVHGKEFMVEYRVYPSLPWLAILFALLVASAFKENLKGANIAAATAIVVLGLLCVKRSLAWQSEQSIVENITRQYPLHIRSQSYIQALDYRSGRYDAVIQRQQHIEDTLNAILRYNRETSRHHRQYDAAQALASFMAGEQFVGYALIAQGHSQPAIDRLTEVMQMMRPFFRNDKGIAFAVLYRARGKAKAALGEKMGAREDYEACLERKPNDAETLALLEELGS